MNTRLFRVYAPFVACAFNATRKVLWLTLILGALLPLEARAQSVESSGKFIVKLNRDRIMQLKAESPELSAYSSSEIARALVNYIGGKTVEELPLIDAAVVEDVSGTELQGENLETAAEFGLVEYIEPDYVVKALAVPNDPSFSQLWGMHNTGQSGGVADVDIDAPVTWDTRTDSNPVVVGVIDTGVDYNHPDLQDNMWTNPGEVAGNGVDDDGNGVVDDVHGYNAITNSGNPMDDHSHGTHCSGTIGGRGNNGVGVAGVAWQTKIMALKFLSAGGSGSISDAIKAVNYAVAMKQRGVNVRVLSNSWGGGGFSQAMKDAISAANNQGILFVAAAGNSAADNDSGSFYPANYDMENVVSVAAIDRTGALASFSNYGRTKVHVGAPGVSIYSTTPGNSYGTMSGTSMATPHVSGIAALSFAARPGLSPRDLRALLIAAVKPLPALTNKTVSGGMISAYRAVTGDFTFPPVIKEIPDQAVHMSIGHLDIPFEVSDADHDPITLSVSAVPADKATVSVVGSAVSFTPVADYLGDVNVTLSANDGTHTTTDAFKVTVHNNGAPTVLAISDRKVRMNGTVWVNPTVYDTEGDTLVAEARVTPSYSGSVWATTTYVYFAANEGYLGDVNVEYAVSDRYSTTRRTFKITVEENQPPVMTAPDAVTMRRDDTKFVAVTTSDANLDYVRLTATLDPVDAATLQVYSNGISVKTAPDAPAAFVLTIQASDGVLSVEKQVQVTVKDNTPPVIEPIANYVARAGSPVSINVTSSDADEDNLTATAKVMLSDASGPVPTILYAYPSWIYVDVPADQTAPFTVVLTVSDGRDSATRSIVVTISENGWSGVDTDGDGVTDVEEGSEGTDPEDGGSAQPELGRTVCSEWNGFLGGMWNVLEHVNRSYEAITVETTLYSIAGAAMGSVQFAVQPGAQYDLSVHDMVGWSLDSYGKVCSKVVSGQPGSLDGRMVYYHQGADSSFDFAFAMPFLHGKRGSQFVPFNTFQPSLDSADGSNIVTNWIQLTNLSINAQRGALTYYDMQGQVLAAETIEIAAGARQDFSGHRFGANLVGMVSWVPEDLTASFQLRNVRYYYNNPFGIPEFDGAFQLEGVSGSGRTLVAPLDLRNASSILEISNTLDREVESTVQVFSEAGVLLEQKMLVLPAYGSQHIITDGILGGRQRGTALIRAGVPNALIATVMQYGRNPNGGIKHIYGIQLKETVGSSLKGSYNTFLHQSCELTVVNSSAEPVSATLDMFDFAGRGVVGSQRLLIPAHGEITSNVCLYDQADRYGVVNVYADTANSLVGSLVRIGENDAYRFPTPLR